MVDERENELVIDVEFHMPAEEVGLRRMTYAS